MQKTYQNKVNEVRQLLIEVIVNLVDRYGTFDGKFRSDVKCIDLKLELEIDDIAIHAVTQQEFIDYQGHYRSFYSVSLDTLGEIVDFLTVKENNLYVKFVRNKK